MRNQLHALFGPERCANSAWTVNDLSRFTSVGLILCSVYHARRERYGRLANTFQIPST
jgi:hypothetical protein